MANDLRVTASLQDNLTGGLNQITESLGKNKKAAEGAKNISKRFIIWIDKCFILW